ncbi:hypothetical protein [uncultured Algibacter sp.]|uniref:hypothetical protein n=1 Tax=uncultured Algibacter sp. TaxID=298659 RepID=UPI002609181E|nr:hypothetical protein [uncultured Algibacter sp.]
MSEKIFSDDCFIICPIGKENSDERKHSDKLLNHVFKPVLDSKQYNTIRADQVAKVGLITTQIINLILESSLVIADLTDQNPNVFYELALRHASRKPYIQVIKKGQKIPFDLAGIRTIQVDIKDLDDVENAKKQIEEQIKEIENGHIPDSPVTVATTTRLIQDDDNLAETIVSRIYGAINWDGGYSYDDNDKLDTIARKLWSFREYGSTNLEDIERKLDDISNKIDNKK